MNKNWVYLLALLILPMLRLLINELHYDDWLRTAHYEKAADFVAMLRGNAQFQAFIGGYVFPAFLVMVLIFWIMEEDKNRIPTQFILLPLAYIPFSIVGFTLVNAEFQVSYLYTNTIIILGCGYIYVGLWVGIAALLEKVKVIES